MLRYHVRVDSLAQRLLEHIRRNELLRPGERVGVAVSGGIDSVALLRLMLELRGELGIVPSVIHFNHKLRGAESESDEQFVAEMACERGLEFYCDSDDVAGHAGEQGVSLETAARELRYGFFRHLIRENDTRGLKPSSEGEPLPGPEGPLFQEVRGRMHMSNERGTVQPINPKLDKIVTGHTLDDQAETVLMRLIRGAGMRGLGGIHPRIPVEDEGETCGEIVRPLLEVRRHELEAYLKEIGQTWREDATNAEVKFTRNRIRKLLVPLLEREFNPSIAQNLAELAEIARGEEDYWDNEVAGWMGTGVHWSEPAWAQKVRAAGSLVQIGLGSTKGVGEGNGVNDLQSRIENAPWLVMNASVDLLWFAGEPTPVQRRIVKAVGDKARIPLEFKHVEEIRNFAVYEGDGGKELSLPLGWTVRREQHDLVFVTPDLGAGEESRDYEHELRLQQPVQIPELRSSFELRSVDADSAAYNPGQLLDADSVPGLLRVRNWRAGDRFWPSHTKSPKKIKELLQEHHVPQVERKLWPVVLNGDEIVWVRGFAVPSRLQAKPGRKALAIVETRTQRESGTY